MILKRSDILVYHFGRHMYTEPYKPPIEIVSLTYRNCTNWSSYAEAGKRQGKRMTERWRRERQDQDILWDKGHIR